MFDDKNIMILKEIISTEKENCYNKTISLKTKVKVHQVI
jgi:hypothetical protein